ncbi:MAG: 16S rRNA methyltransferase [Candidatus Bathyarchaeia archaeon]
MLTLIIAESALETIPENLWTHPAVTKWAKAHRKHPQYVLLDRSYHHAAMKKLGQNEKRGRPDIVHFALLEALGSPLNREGLLTVYVHASNDHVIWVNPEARLPRNYSRFVSLIEQLFEFGKVPPNAAGRPLLTLKKQTLPELIKEIKPSYVLALTTIGKPHTLEASISNLAQKNNPAVLVGGFPKGHFSNATLNLAHEILCMDHEMLETWTVVSRVTYEFERALSLPSKRLKT